MMFGCCYRRDKIKRHVLNDSGTRTNVWRAPVEFIVIKPIFISLLAESSLGLMVHVDIISFSCIKRQKVFIWIFFRISKLSFYCVHRMTSVDCKHGVRKLEGVGARRNGILSFTLLTEVDFQLLFLTACVKFGWQAMGGGDKRAE